MVSTGLGTIHKNQKVSALGGAVHGECERVGRRYAGRFEETVLAVCEQSWMTVEERCRCVEHESCTTDMALVLDTIET